MDFGSTLKAAREAKNLTISQVAAKTHILAQTIEGMERNDFKMIPAPIYGRGFVKLIAEYLEADAAMLMELFKAAYANRMNQSSQATGFVQTDRVRTIAPVAEKEVQPFVASVSPGKQSEQNLSPKAREEESRHVVAGQDIASVPPQTTRNDSSVSRFAAPVPGENEDLFNQVQNPAPYQKAPSRFAAPLPDDSDESDSQGVFTYVAEGFSNGVEHARRRIRRVPSSFWRMAVLAVCSIAIVYFIIAGLVKIFGISQNRIPEVKGSVSQSSNAADRSNVPTLEDAVKGKVAPEIKTGKPQHTGKSGDVPLPEPIYFN